MNSQQIREHFARFFQKHGHEKIASSSLIPQNDDTLLFANAGMNQFKDYFTGKLNSPHKKIYTIQKCVRAGGKHNDLDNVGFTARHHTFFEMLGNFSFGSYFKKEAITLAWSFLTEELGISKDKLYATTHESDKESEQIWLKEIGIPRDHLFQRGDKDNFWEMGQYGPCGPCSEIFFDHGPQFSTPHFKPKKNQNILDDELRYVEIWNLVFMQFEKTPEGQFSLPHPCVDTGMGLERLAACLQGVYWNYDIDGFQKIIKAIENLTGKSYENKKYQGSIRVVADHIRSCTMLVTDGVIPSNEGRGYVLRRIIRRAVRHWKELGVKEVSFYKLIPIVFEQLAKEYPQNLANQKMAEQFLKLEEKKFLETLNQGLKFLKDAVKNNLIQKTLPGEKAFQLYDTYGFPLDLTQIILKEKNLKVDLKGFEKSMEERKKDSRKSWKGGQVSDPNIFPQLKNKWGQTLFKGYHSLTTKAKLLEIVDLKKMKGLIFDKTTFYGESGGQVGDTGEIRDDKGTPVAHIVDTQKPLEDFHIHHCQNENQLKIGKEYELVVNAQKRNQIAKNHSATHLLQAALINILGKHIKQAGSHVSSQRLRFDFTHFKAMSEDEIKRVENLVNEQIQSNLPVQTKMMKMNQAMEEGAVALFGEKYGDQVRVLQMGNFSTELCGGTHVHATSEIGWFSIISESSLSSGVRRIEALTSHLAIKRLTERSKYLKELELLSSSKEEQIIDKFQELFSDLKKKQKEIKILNDQINSLKSKELFSNPLPLKGNTPFVVAEAPQGSDLRKLSELFTHQFSQGGILLLYQKNKAKCSVLLRATDHFKNLKCDQILKETLPLIKGRGGGRPSMAQGSGDDLPLKPFIQQVQSLIESSL